MVNDGVGQVLIVLLALVDEPLVEFAVEAVLATDMIVLLLSTLLLLLLWWVWLLSSSLQGPRVFRNSSDPLVRPE